MTPTATNARAYGPACLASSFLQPRIHAVAKLIDLVLRYWDRRLRRRRSRQFLYRCSFPENAVAFGFACTDLGPHNRPQPRPSGKPGRGWVPVGAALLRCRPSTRAFRRAAMITPSSSSEPASSSIESDTASAVVGSIPATRDAGCSGSAFGGLALALPVLMASIRFTAVGV